MKSIIAAALLTLATPAIAIAQDISTLPANYMIWRGKVINLDHLAGKGIATQEPQQAVNAPISPVNQPEMPREVRDNMQRVNFENARAQVLLEALGNRR